MSLEATTWALTSAPTEVTAEFAILIGLANHARRDGTGAWISHAHLAHYARCSVRSVHNHLQSLEAKGIIRRGNQAVIPADIPLNRRPVVWDLALELTRKPSGMQDLHANNDSDTQNIGSRPAKLEPLACNNPASGLQPVADKPSTKPSTKPKTKPKTEPTTVARDEDFELALIPAPVKAAVKAAPNPLAHRIPIGFTPTLEDLAWATERAPDVDTTAATEEFVNHWVDASGPSSRKLAWSRAWRNRMAQNQERGWNLQRRNGVHVGSPVRSRHDENADMVRRMEEREAAAQNGSTHHRLQIGNP